MPSSRRLKVTGFVILLTFLVVIYVTNGAKNTHNSPFYTRTVEAIKNRQDVEARENVIAEEKQRLDRVERLQKEHDVAVGTSKASDSVAQAVGQNPLANNLKDTVKDATAAVGDAAEKAKSGAGEAADKVKGVAGRKTMSNDKVVQTKPATAEGADGVAKVGNVEPKASSAVKGAEDDPESEEDHNVEVELNDILKKGPIIIFSKSYCGFSRKAKNILLNMYTITPPPYVVELDQHPLGEGLQAALFKSTGRRTVPNVLINGKSIGGGDDIAALDRDGKLIETVQAMGGKRVVNVTKNKEEESEDRPVRGLRFRA